MLDEIGGGCHGLRLQAIGRFPFTKRRRDDKAGFSLTSSMYRDLQKGAAHSSFVWFVSSILFFVRPETSFDNENAQSGRWMVV
jgi:hypothetical protein